MFILYLDPCSGVYSRNKLVRFFQSLFVTTVSGGPTSLSDLSKIAPRINEFDEGNKGFLSEEDAKRYIEEVVIQNTASPQEQLRQIKSIADKLWHNTVPSRAYRLPDDPYLAFLPRLRTTMESIQKVHDRLLDSVYEQLPENVRKANYHLYYTVPSTRHGGK